MFEASTPAAAMTGPATDSTTRVTRPSSMVRSATTRTVPAAIAASRSAATNPRAFDATLLDTTNTSPSATLKPSARTPVTTSAARSSPGPTSGIPVTGTTQTPSGTDSGQPHTRSTAAPAMSAAASTLDISSGRASTASRPLDTTSPSSSETSQPSRKSSYSPATAPAVEATPMASRQASACPRTGRPLISGDTPTTGAREPRRASRTPGTPRMMPIEHDRVARRQHDEVGRPDRVEDARARPPPVHAGHDEPASGTAACSRTHHSWKWTARSPSPVVQDDVGLDRGVGHRQQGHAAGREPPPVGEPRRHLRQRQALAEPQRARDVGADVAVAEAEPLRLTPYAASSPWTWCVSSARPQPWASLTPPPRV